MLNIATKIAPLAAAMMIAGSAAYAGSSITLQMPNLQFAPSSAQELVTRDVPSHAPGCTQLEKSAAVSPEVCGLMTRSEIVKLKTAQDD